VSSPSAYGIFSTFSTDSLKKGKAAIALEQVWRWTLTTTVHRPIGYGITDRLELDVTVPYVLAWQDSIDGFQDIPLSLKYRFLDEEKYLPSRTFCGRIIAYGKK